MPALVDVLDRAALVVAHPDDEILWFSSIVTGVRKLFFCYGDVPLQPTWTEGRRRIAAEYPLPHATFLGLTESVVFAGVDWFAPVTTEYGLEVRKRPGRTLPAFDSDRYRANYRDLIERLRDELRDCSVVITHNPWGEYGNEEHVQVHRAVARVQKDLGYELWFDNYCSDRAYALMLNEVATERFAHVTLPTNPDVVHELEALYRRWGCWTWPFDDYAYFDQESFFRRSTMGSGASGATLPLNFIHLNERPAEQPEPSLRERLRPALSRVLHPFG